MARRAKRVKLSKAQELENELNRQLAKRDAAISMLVKAVTKLKQLQRSQVRLQKASKELNRAVLGSMDLVDCTEAKPAEVRTPEELHKKMEALGFHKAGRKRKPKVLATT